MTSDDERFMRQALELARSVPSPSPNPRVGAVFVRGGEVVATGVHRGPGTLHAEAAAIATGADLRGTTCYVNLEPCIHRGRTPPCAPDLVAARVARVVGSLEDPDARVSGDGFAYLAEHGIDTTVGALAEDARAANAAYIHHRTTGRPLVTLKLALSLDGRLGAPDGSARWITSAETRARVHRRRADSDAVIVGAGTVIADDPQLTARDVGAHRQPLRVAVDAAGRIPPGARIFTDDAPTLIATTDRSTHEVQMAWKERGAEVIVLPEDVDGGVDLDTLVAHLGERDLLDVLCEGGGALATSVLSLDLADRLEVHFGPVVLGRGGPEIGDLGVTGMADAHRWRLLEVNRSGPDALLLFERSED